MAENGGVDEDDGEDDDDDDKRRRYGRRGGNRHKNKRSFHANPRHGKCATATGASVEHAEEASGSHKRWRLRSNASVTVVIRNATLKVHPVRGPLFHLHAHRISHYTLWFPCTEFAWHWAAPKRCTHNTCGHHSCIHHRHFIANASVYLRASFIDAISNIYRSICSSFCALIRDKFNRKLHKNSIVLTVVSSWILYSWNDRHTLEEKMWKLTNGL